MELEAELNKYNKKKNAEYISSLKSISWGESHGVLLDKKGRVFTFGSTVSGRLGFPDKDLQETIGKPT